MPYYFFFIYLIFSACTVENSVGSKDITAPADFPNTIATATTIYERFLPPKGFKKLAPPPTSFAHYLQHLPLKPNNTPVYLYNGDEKSNQSVHAGVIDLDVGKRDLQQCADAIMRLRSEYLYGQKAFDKIKFNFTNGFPAEFSRWSSGQGIQVKGNKVQWVSKATNNESYPSFRKYLNLVFSYAGTLSLDKELPKKDISAMTIGDIFIQGGSPGHAVIIVDMAVNPHSKKKAFLLAQSYMPAQDIHVLKNPSSPQLSPWYILEESQEVLQTPEWQFSTSDLKVF